MLGLNFVQQLVNATDVLISVTVVELDAQVEQLHQKLNADMRILLHNLLLEFAISDGQGNYLQLMAKTSGGLHKPPAKFDDVGQLTHAKRLNILYLHIRRFTFTKIATSSTI
jgi:hypothetical protein